MSVRFTRPLIAGAVLGTVAALAAGCASGRAPAAAHRSVEVPHPSSPSSLTSTAGSESAVAVAAYRAMWGDVAEASNTADYQASYLSNHLAGAALVTITDNLAVEHAQGVVAHGTPVLHPVVTSVAPTVVTVSDCQDDRGWLQYIASTDKLVNNIPGGFRSTTATVTEQGGTWKVTQLNTGTDGSCTLGSHTG